MFGEKTRTWKKLDLHYHAALKVPYDLKRDRYVIFSDLHLADRINGIDEFAPNEMVLCHALQHYYDEEFHLVLNGDVEEGWEARPRRIRDAYRDTVYALERKFAEKGEPWHIRIWGNHDNIWANPDKVKKHLWPEIGPVNVYPGIRLGENIFIAHGHQGELISDSGAWISEPMLRFGWRWVQRLTRMTSARAATNNLIRNTRAEYLYRWGVKHGQMIVAGHTHRAMFGYLPERNDLINHMRRLEATLADNPLPYQARATIDHLRKTVAKGRRRRHSGENRLPVYFNSGSCVHTNGITCLEIDRGEIRLVRWRLVETSTDHDGLGNEDGLLFTIKPRVLQRADLAEVIAQIRIGTGRSQAGHPPGRNGVDRRETALEKDDDVHAAA